MIFTFNCKGERLDGSGLEETAVDILVEEIALLRIDTIRFGEWATGEIVMRSGFRTTLYARWLDWEDLRKHVYMKQ